VRQEEIFSKRYGWLAVAALAGQQAGHDGLKHKHTHRSWLLVLPCTAQQRVDTGPCTGDGQRSYSSHSKVGALLAVVTCTWCFGAAVVIVTLC
jgi:hypothetical protein